MTYLNSIGLSVSVPSTTGFDRLLPALGAICRCPSHSNVQVLRPGNPAARPRVNLPHSTHFLSGSEPRSIRSTIVTRFNATTDLSAIPAGPACPSRASGWALVPQTYQGYRRLTAKIRSRHERGRLAQPGHSQRDPDTPTSRWSEPRPR